ncbi:MAG: ABC transporter permease subunit [Kiritimatiellae bacterium]|nr:ABC transporter permease subunit [Kiritimatiellia bacterium]
MPLIPTIGRKSFKNRLIMAVIYLVLSALGLTMIVPFMITLSGSVSGAYDYSRYQPIPRYFFSRGDRFVKNLSSYFDGYRAWQRQLRAYVPDIPRHWSNWPMSGRDRAGCADLATSQMRPGNAVAAADYAEFMHDYPLEDTSVFAPQVHVARFLTEQYGDISRISDEWGTAFDSIYSINFNAEMYHALDFQSYFPDLTNPKFLAFCRLKEHEDAFAYTPGIRKAWAKWAEGKGLACGDVFPVLRSSPKDVRDAWLDFKRELAPATMATPYPLRIVWYDYLGSEEVSQQHGGQYTVERLNGLLGTSYATIYETPFPIPDDFPEEIVSLYRTFQKERFPLRLARLKVTPEMTGRFREFAQRNIGRIEELNKLLGSDYSSWDEVPLPEVAPEGGERTDVNRRNLWVNFAKTLSADEREYESSEIRWQRFLLAKYGGLDAVNAAYGTKYSRIEECFPPFIEAYRVQFANFGSAMSFSGMKDNYRMIMSYLIHTGNALPVTFVLIALSIIFTLTINPLAAYALSRFNLRGRDKIIVFMLATMAFPAMVSAIPAYLLMRDLGMLNTMAALVLPGAANGMAIFILKGFFDSLPMELFEAATIDGASEMQIFRIVAMPLVKPILAINCLNAFIGAYNGWEWALIICQNRDMWTLAVWMYQASQWWSASPWVVSAGFVIISIPTMIVFITCQKVILRGIIIPSMK